MFYESVLFTVTLVQKGMIELAATTLYLRYGQFATVLIWHPGENSILAIYYRVNWQESQMVYRQL